jgi:tetratricopeptide (TPR) repeat protein
VNEERIERLLSRADETAGAPGFGPVTVAGMRRRVHRGRLIRVGTPSTAAALLLIGVILWWIGARTPKPQPPPQRIASLEEQVRQLQAQTEMTLKLVQEVLDKDRQQRRLAALEAELASIPDPLQEIDRQVDKTAFILVYQADKLYRELNQTESAVRAYKEVIQLFPTNQWAQVARERLSEIEQRRINKSQREKGEPKWEPRNT